jgi:hypothetical protein
MLTLLKILITLMTIQKWPEEKFIKIFHNHNTNSLTWNCLIKQKNKDSNTSYYKHVIQESGYFKHSLTKDNESIC